MWPFFGQFWSILVDLNSRRKFKGEEIWSILVDFDQICSNLVDFGRFWSIWVVFGHHVFPRRSFKSHHPLLFGKVIRRRGQHGPFFGENVWPHVALQAQKLAVQVPQVQFEVRTASLKKLNWQYLLYLQVCEGARCLAIVKTSVLGGDKCKTNQSLFNTLSRTRRFKQTPWPMRLKSISAEAEAIIIFV